MVRSPLLCLFLIASPAFAQFTPALLQNDSYWGDGKAEFNIYDAQIMREGALRPCEALHILVREPTDSKLPGAVPVLKLNQVLHLPIGLYVHQQMHSNLWRIDNAPLLRFSVTSSDSIANTYKEGRREGEVFGYEDRTSSDGAAGAKENVSVPANCYFYD